MKTKSFSRLAEIHNPNDYSPTTNDDSMPQASRNDELRTKNYILNKSVLFRAFRGLKLDTFGNVLDTNGVVLDTFGIALATFRLRNTP